MKQTITTICFLLLFACQLSAGNSNPEDEFTRDIRYLFKINGTETSYKKNIKAVFAQFKKMESDAPKEYWNKAEQEFLNTSVDEITNMIIPIYKKFLTPEDIKAYIRFFESPAGKHIAQQTPSIAAESMQVGMLWGKTIGEKIAADIENKGYKLRMPFGL